VTRFHPAVLWLLLPACAGGEQWRITDSTTTLGDEDEGSDEESGPAISASASASGATSSSGSSGDATTATTQPVDGSTDTGGGSSSSTGVEGESSTSSGEGASSTGDPATIDLSGWSIVQAASDRTFDIPDGTLLPVGGVLVIGRDVDQATFENYWGVTLGQDVVFISGADEFPNINGDETYALRDAADTMVDGPTPALTVGESLDRIDPEDGGATGWANASADVGTPTPGTSVEPPPGFTGVFLSEVSDANGIGSFVYEFVELRAF
jgi:hypothetical protein